MSASSLDALDASVLAVLGAAIDVLADLATQAQQQIIPLADAAVLNSQNTTLAARRLKIDPAFSVSSHSAAFQTAYAAFWAKEHAASPAPAWSQLFTPGFIVNPTVPTPTESFWYAFGRTMGMQIYVLVNLLCVTGDKALIDEMLRLLNTYIVPELALYPSTDILLDDVMAYNVIALVSLVLYVNQDLYPTDFAYWSSLFSARYNGSVWNHTLRTKGFSHIQMCAMATGWYAYLFTASSPFLTQAEAFVPIINTPNLVTYTPDGRVTWTERFPVPAGDTPQSDSADVCNPEEYAGYCFQYLLMLHLLGWADIFTMDTLGQTVAGMCLSNGVFASDQCGNVIAGDTGTAQGKFLEHQYPLWRRYSTIVAAWSDGLAADPYPYVFRDAANVFALGALR